MPRDLYHLEGQQLRRLKELAEAVERHISLAQQSQMTRDAQRDARSIANTIADILADGPHSRDEED